MTDEIIPSGKSLKLPGAVSEDAVIPSGKSLAAPKSAPGWDTADVGKSVGSKLVQGTTALADLPGDIAKGGIGLAERVTGYDIPDWAERGMMALTPGGMGRAVSGESSTEAVTRELPSVMGYEPKSTAGRYAGNVAYMAPAAATAALSGGASLLPTLVGGAVVPGLSGELARDIGERASRAGIVGTENPEQTGEAFKLGAELLSPFAAAKFLPSVGTAIKNPAMRTPAEEIERLRASGINVTPGSYRPTQEAALAGASGDLTNPKMAAIIGKQPEQFSNFALKTSGITDDMARSYGYTEGLTPMTAPKVVNAELSRIGPQIGQTYDAILARNFPVQLWSKIRNLANGLPDVPAFDPSKKTSGEWLHDIRQGANQIIKKGELKSHIRDAGNLISYIDDAITHVVGPSGREALDAANAQFSRLKSLQDAFEIAANNRRSGVIHPSDMTAVGGTRHTADVSEIASIADKYLIPQGAGRAVSPSKGRTLMQYGRDAVGGALASAPAMMAYGMPSDIPSIVKAVTAAAAGAAGTDLVQRALRAAKGSSYAQNVARSKALYGTPMAPMLAAPALNAADDRIGRKSGGRVGDHMAAADHLVRAAERAKNDLGKTTEPLLNQSDDAVAHALEVANRSI